MPRIDMKQFFQSRLARTVSLRNDIVEVHLFQVMYLSVITIQLSNQPLQKATVLNIFWCIRGHAEAVFLVIMPAVKINVLARLLSYLILIAGGNKVLRIILCFADRASQYNLSD